VEKKEKKRAGEKERKLKGGWKRRSTCRVK